MQHLDTIPEELRAARQWVTWRYEKEGQPVSKDTSGATKIPYNARTGHKASSTNPNTWAPFDVAVKAASQRKHSGVGFVFSADDEFTGIDLDDCIKDGALEPWALDIVTTMNSYTEISPSGEGVKIWVKGTIPSSVKTPQIEIYSSARYFTVTGRHFDSTPTTIRNVNGALTRLYDSVKKEDSPAPLPTPQPRASVGDDHARQWAQRKLADAIRMVTMAPDGLKHDTLLDAARLAGGASPYLSETEIETALFAAIEGRAADKRGAHKTIRDGIRLGMSAPLPIPEPPAQPTFDQQGYACCPTHARRLDAAKNGNGYKCRAKDATTASGWCDFWWKGDGYIPPQPTVSESLATVTGDAHVIQTPKSMQAFQLYRMGDLRNIPPVEWLIPGELPANLFTVLCGPSESGKSFQAVDYAMHTARLNPDRLVVYVAPEGGSGYLKRCEAWLAQYGGEQPENLVFILRAVPVLDAMAVASFIASIRNFQPVLIILDTLARCLVGGDENSAKDIGVFVEGCDEIRRQTGAAVLVVHHTGKSGNYRGSSALYGACDSWIDFANDDGLITLSCGKAKDWKQFEPRYMRMVERGESVVLLPSNQVSQREAGLTEGKRKVLETLALDVFQGPGAKASQIMNSTGIAEKTLYRILSHLKRDGYVNQGNRGDPYTITNRGMDAIKDYHRALRETRANELSDGESGATAELSRSVTNSHQFSHPSDSTVTSVTPPLKGWRVTESSDREVPGPNDSDLFADDSHHTEVLPPLEVALPATPPALDWVYLKARFASGDYAGIKTHCAMRRADVDMVLEQLEQAAASGGGRTPEGY